MRARSLLVWTALTVAACNGACSNDELAPLVDDPVIGATVVTGDADSIVAADLVSSGGNYGDEGPHVRGFVDGVAAWDELVGENTNVRTAVAAPTHVAVLVTGVRDDAIVHTLALYERATGSRRDVELQEIPDGLTRDGDGFALVELSATLVAGSGDRGVAAATLVRVSPDGEVTRSAIAFADGAPEHAYALLSPVPRALLAIAANDVVLTLADSLGQAEIYALDDSGDDAVARVVDVPAVTDTIVEQLLDALTTDDGVVITLARKQRASVAVAPPSLRVLVRDGVATRALVEGALVGCVTDGLAGVVGGTGDDANDDGVFLLDDVLVPQGASLGVVPPRGSLSCFAGTAVDGVGVKAGNAVFFVPRG